jgi:hypothetical protein
MLLCSRFTSGSFQAFQAEKGYNVRPKTPINQQSLNAWCHCHVAEIDVSLLLLLLQRQTPKISAKKSSNRSNP